MQAFVDSVRFLALQLALAHAAAACVCLALRGARRGPRVRWRLAERGLRPATMAALPFVILTGLLRRLAVGSVEPEPWILFAPGLFAGASAGLTAGAWLLLRAAAHEIRGRASRSRRLARFAGQWMFVGSALVVSSLGLRLITMPADERLRLLREAPAHTVVLLCATLSLGVAGFAGLLGGLSGKPRPTGYVAAGLTLGGFVVLVVAGEGARALAGG
ncbi:MAG: hypothetical protein GY716_05430 [bacterium]|nr:hypothetical protein [bacterium]